MNGIPRVLMLLTAACALSGCVCWDHHHHLYATDFDLRDGPYVLAWPADASGSEFRYLVEPHAGELAGLEVRKTGDQGAAPPAGAAGVIVVLPEDPDAALRDHANAFLSTVAASSPGAGTHLVTDSADWQRIRRAEDAIRRIYRLRADATRRRPIPGMWADAFGRLIFAALHMTRSPDAIITPLAGSPDRFLVATGLPFLPENPSTVDDVTVGEFDREGVLTRVRERGWDASMDEEVRETWRQLGFDWRPVILLVRPDGTPPEHAAAFDTLLVEVAACPGVTVVTRATGVAYATLDGPAGLREVLDATAIPFAHNSLLRPPEQPRE